MELNRLEELLQDKSKIIGGLVVGDKKSLVLLAKKWLISELKKSNYRLSEPVLDNIIANRRQITVSECIVFAKIFGLKDFRDVLQKKK